MSAQSKSTNVAVQDFPNGGGAAALLAAGVGSLMVAVFAILADKIGTIKSMMNFYKPTGPLSGVTTMAIVVWLVTFASCSIVGLPLLFHEGWSMGEIRQMARAEEKAGEAALLEEAEQGADVKGPR